MVRHGAPFHTEALRRVLAWRLGAFPDANVVAAGHRVVHGGVHYDAPVLVTDEVLRELERLVPLAPLHQPHNIAGILAAREAWPHVRAGRVLRHRVPPRASVRQRRVRPAPPLLRRGRAALRLPRPVLRIYHAKSCGRSRRCTRPAASSSRISAMAPRCAPSATGSPSRARWASRRWTACRWAPAAVSSIRASCSISCRKER